MIALYKGQIIFPIISAVHILNICMWVYLLALFIL
jgi:hypothetical protein